MRRSHGGQVGTAACQALPTNNNGHSFGPVISMSTAWRQASRRSGLNASEVGGGTWGKASWRDEVGPEGDGQRFEPMEDGICPR